MAGGVVSTHDNIPQQVQVKPQLSAEGDIVQQQLGHTPTVHALIYELSSSFRLAGIDGKAERSRKRHREKRAAGKRQRLAMLREALFTVQYIRSGASDS